jgi:hypothetical protein
MRASIAKVSTAPGKRSLALFLPHRTGIGQYLLGGVGVDVLEDPQRLGHRLV